MLFSYFYFVSLGHVDSSGLVGIEDGALAYALGQLSYSVMLGVLYLLFIHRHDAAILQKLIPKRVFENGKWVLFDSYLIYITFCFSAQTFLKHLLTYGDKFAFLIFGSDDTAQKGAYHIVSSLGLFQIINIKDQWLPGYFSIL